MNSAKPLLARVSGVLFSCFSLLILAAGCDIQNPIDPTEMGRFKNEALVVPIVSVLDRNIEEPEDEFLYASDVEPQDLKPRAGEYAISKSDLLSISITDLVGPNIETVKTTRVGDTGTVSLPLIGSIQAAGLTESQMEQAISKAYADAKLIQKAQVSVTVAEARGRTFSVLGAAGGAGMYVIDGNDFKMLNALVSMRDVPSPAPEYIYIIRENQSQPTTQPAAPATQPAKTTEPPQDLLEPKSALPATHPLALNHQRKSVVLLQDQPATQEAEDQDDVGKFVTVDGKTVMMNDASKSPTTQPATSSATQPQSAMEVDVSDKEAEEVAAGDQTRSIRIPIGLLKSGDLRYNIVIYPKDIIIVPPATLGEYYIGGHVQRVGVYSLSARKITLKQAVVAAGMLDGVAIPQRTQIIRRIGADKEVFCRVDLAQIFSGEQPDIYLKPNDIVQVGTNLWAPYAAAVRNSFRFTYGFGFLYDRNFAPIQGTGR